MNASLCTLDAQVFVRIGFGKAFELLLRLAVAGIGCGDVVELFGPLDIGEVEFAQQRRLLVPLDRIVAGETARRIDRQAVAALDQHGHALAVVGNRVKRRGGGDVLQFEPVVARVVERHRIDQGGLAARRKLFDVDLPGVGPDQAARNLHLGRLAGARASPPPEFPSLSCFSPFFRTFSFSAESVPLFPTQETHNIRFRRTKERPRVPGTSPSAGISRTRPSAQHDGPNRTVPYPASGGIRLPQPDFRNYKYNFFAL